LTGTTAERWQVICRDARNDPGTLHKDASTVPRSSSSQASGEADQNAAMKTTKDERSSTPDRAHQPAMADRTQRGAGWPAWALTAGSALLLLLAVVLVILNRDLGWRALSPHMFLVPGFAVVGLVLAVRRPRHPIGWLFVAMGLVAAIHAFAFEYAVRALATAPGSLPAPEWLAWVAYWTWPLNLLGLALLLLLFPDGRLPSRRWHLVPWLLGLAFVGITSWTMLHPTVMDVGVVKIANPAGIAALDDRAIQGVGLVPGIVVTTAVLVGSVACALAPFVRRRRAQPIERQQLKWLAAVAAASGLAGAAGFVMAGFGNTSVALAGRLLLLLALVGIAVGIPAAVGVAILRYRLYDLDRLINRTLVYGLLTILLGGLYVAIVLSLGQLAGGIGADRPSWAVACATLVVAALFQPARRRIQQVVDRRFDRRRYDAAKTVEAFSTRLRDEIDLDSLAAELLAVVEQTTQPTQASLWLRPSQAPRQQR
jgi:hypothetical protein